MNQNINYGSDGYLDTQLSNGTKLGFINWQIKLAKKLKRIKLEMGIP